MPLLIAAGAIGLALGGVMVLALCHVAGRELPTEPGSGRCWHCGKPARPDSETCQYCEGVK